MTCQEFDATVEPVAAGEVDLPAPAAEHLAGCPACAARLALARRIERTLASRASPEAPARFSAAVMERVRRDRWRAEQRVDWFFNGAMAAAAVLVASGVWMLFNLAGAAEVARAGSLVVADGLRLATAQLAAQLPAYAGATGLLLSAVAVWWWAERAQ